MRGTSLRRLLPAMVAAVLAGSAPAAAQTNEELFEQFQWNFATPGARAAAMGQTFIGIADDASATVTNPAGLVNLGRRQVYVEFKSTNYEVQRFAAVNSFSTRQTQTFGERNASLSFIDVAIPINSRLAVAFTRHEFLNAREDFTLQPRPIPGAPPPGFIAFPVRAESEFIGTSYAGSVAFAVVPAFKIGATVSFNQFSAQAQSTRFNFVGTINNPTTTSLIVNRSTIDDTATGTAVTIGALFTPREMLTIGVVYGKGPDFAVEQDFQGNSGFFSGINSTFVSLPGFPTETAINVPDRIGVGIGIRPQPRLLIGIDIQRIQYSSLTEDLTVVINPDVTALRDAFSVADGTEFHFGAEYMLMTGSLPVFVRGGAYTNPHHGIRYSPIGNATLDPFYTALFNLSDGDAQVAATVGAGLTLGRSVQLDFAFIQGGDFVASAALRF